MKISKIYYLPFTADTAYPVDENAIKASSLSLDVTLLSKMDEYVILSCLKDKLCNRKFDNKYLRMRLEADNGKTILLVDGNGCVKWRTNEYFMYPSGFLRLYDRLEVLRYKQKQQNSKERGKPSNDNEKGIAPKRR
jgi:hypothetical protein